MQAPYATATGDQDSRGQRVSLEPVNREQDATLNQLAAQRH